MNKAIKILLKHFDVAIHIARANGSYKVDCVCSDGIITTAKNPKLRVATSDAFCGFIAKQGLDQAEIDQIGLQINKACKVR